MHEREIPHGPDAALCSISITTWQQHIYIFPVGRMFTHPVRIPRYKNDVERWRNCRESSFFLWSRYIYRTIWNGFYLVICKLRKQWRFIMEQNKKLGKWKALLLGNNRNGVCYWQCTDYAGRPISLIRVVSYENAVVRNLSTAGSEKNIENIHIIIFKSWNFLRFSPRITGRVRIETSLLSDRPNEVGPADGCGHSTRWLLRACRHNDMIGIFDQVKPVLLLLPRLGKQWNVGRGDTGLLSTASWRILPKKEKELEIQMSQRARENILMSQEKRSPKISSAVDYQTRRTTFTCFCVSYFHRRWFLGCPLVVKVFFFPSCQSPNTRSGWRKFKRL